MNAQEIIEELIKETQYYIDNQFGGEWLILNRQVLVNKIQEIIDSKDDDLNQ
jgi:hypothetical protein